MFNVKPALQAWMLRLSIELDTVLKKGDELFVSRLSKDYFMVNAYKELLPVDKKGFARSFDPLPITERFIAFGLVDDPVNVLVGYVDERGCFQSTLGITHDTSMILWWTYVQDSSRIVLRHKAKQMEKQF